MQLDSQGIRSQLEREILARYGVLPNGTTLPEANKLNGITNASNSLDKLDFKQSLVDSLEDKEFLLIHLYREFTKKDDGKVLAAELGKLARFVQSEVAKADKKIDLSS
jgi:hypothetical protein